MRTRGGFVATCECGDAGEFLTVKQREAWVLKKHVGHTYWTWRSLKAGRAVTSAAKPSRSATGRRTPRKVV